MDSLLKYANENKRLCVDSAILLNRRLSSNRSVCNTFFDFCAGIGSAHLAFSNLGLKCVGYSEIDQKAESVYKTFYGYALKNYGDLMQIQPHTLDDFDILCAGFPCQAFSIVGQRKGFEDERGQIIYGLSEIIKEKKPKAFLLENVKGLANINKGSALKQILTLLSGCGYQIFYKILVSTDYDIPQARERIYFVGIRSDLYKGEFYFPSKIKTQKKLSDFLIDETDDFVLKDAAYQTFQRYLCNKYNNEKYDIDDLLKQNYLVLDTRQSDLRLYYHKIPTLRTGRQGILYVKNHQLRKLSGMEALLLQGFDLKRARLAQENFSQTSILSQAGNAMTVNVMQAIGKNILEYLS